MRVRGDSLALAEPFSDHCSCFNVVGEGEELRYCQKHRLVNSDSSFSREWEGCCASAMGCMVHS